MLVKLRPMSFHQKTARMLKNDSFGNTLANASLVLNTNATLVLNVLAFEPRACEVAAYVIPSENDANAKE